MHIVYVRVGAPAHAQQSVRRKTSCKLLYEQEIVYSATHTPHAGFVGHGLDVIYQSENHRRKYD